MHSTFVPDGSLTETSPIARRPAQRPGLRTRRDAAGPERYDLYRNRHEPGLHCAVPAGKPAPARLQPDEWQCIGRMEEASAPLGFDPEAAGVGIRFNGFHLFIAFGPQKTKRQSQERQPWTPPLRSRGASPVASSLRM